MVKLYDNGAFLLNGKELVNDNNEAFDIIKQKTGKEVNKDECKKNTIAYNILEKHNTSGNMDKLKIKFDAMASHDITYVGIVQTARASGLEKFPIPYVLTNCHNSLCAVGGTINEDDHLFGLSCAKKYGGIYVPTHQAVIHQYMREMMSGCGKMLLGSDSHTRYGALGTMAVGEGGPELVKQLLSKTYDINMPNVVGIYLTGEPIEGVGPQDVALAIIGAVFDCGYVKNGVMEFIGDGIDKLTVEYRNGIDVMTTETTCLSSIWKTDDKVKGWYETHNRASEYSELNPGEIAYYDGIVHVDMSEIRPMIAMPFHPSNIYTIDHLNENLNDILDEIEKIGKTQLDNDTITFTLKDKVKNGKFHVEQGIIAGCAGGTYENICVARNILKGHSIGNDEFALSVYPSSQPVFVSLVENGTISDLMLTGATVRSAFCGPCFGAGDVPANNTLSVRHATRNFPNREGSKITSGQIASVALMDARSVAATALNKGVLTPATEVNFNGRIPRYAFNSEVYANRCYDGFDKPDTSVDLKFGPNIVDWPKMGELTDDLILKVVSVINDPVTTTDELIPSGETSSYRSNPLGLAEFTLSRKDPLYVGRAKEVSKIEQARIAGEDLTASMGDVYKKIKEKFADFNAEKTSIGSVIYAVKPGDGSAREQAASCQKVLGGFANIATEYATKRYRSNLINWGMIPFILKEDLPFANEQFLYVPNIKEKIKNGEYDFTAYLVDANGLKEFKLAVDELTKDEQDIILAGCLINYYKK